MIDVTTFREFMVGRRTVLGITERKAFARISGASDTLVWQIETGRGIPFHARGDVTRQKIADALQVPLVALDAFSRGDESAIKPYPFIPGIVEADPTEKLFDALRRANLTETQAVHILDEYILHAASYRTTVAELMRGALYLWTVEKVVKANNGQLGQEIELVDHEQDPVQANRDHISKKAAQQVIEAPRVQIRSDTAGKGDKRSS